MPAGSTVLAISGVIGRGIFRLADRYDDMMHFIHLVRDDVDIGDVGKLVQRPLDYKAAVVVRLQGWGVGLGQGQMQVVVVRPLDRFGGAW